MERYPFHKLVQDELEQVEAILQERPPGQHETIGTAVDHLIGGGGKRLRPTLVLLSGHHCGADMERAVFAAAAVEMLHTATLIHDDLIDGSLIRRSVGTLNARWSPSTTILVGDYIFARAAVLASQANNVRLVQRFAETLATICNGEIRQMFDGRGLSTDRREYEQRIYAKTASLIAMSVESGAILAAASEETTNALRTYGERLGLAFQIVDDVLDFVADEQTLGKPVGSDLRQGLITLPTLLFLEATPDHTDVRRALSGRPAEATLQRAVAAVACSAAVEQAQEIARAYAEQAIAALDQLADSRYRTALVELAEFTVRRRF